MTTRKQAGLEESLARLEAIVQKLEKGEQPLEESLRDFEEGLALGKRCREILDQAELRIKRLVEVDESGNVTTEDADIER